MFKDHLVKWVTKYLESIHGKTHAKEILADIHWQCVFLPSNGDQILSNSLISIAAVPLFPGLPRFPEGCGFKQWTGDDSKALMKVFF